MGLNSTQMLSKLTPNFSAKHALPNNHSKQHGIYLMQGLAQYTHVEATGLCSNPSLRYRNIVGNQEINGMYRVSVTQGYTVHPESIHNTSLFPHFVKLQPYSKME